MGRFTLRWLTDSDGRVTDVTVDTRTKDLDGLPTLTKGNTPGVSLHINVGIPTDEKEVEHTLRTAQGILGLFILIEIIFEDRRVEWIGETEEEKERIQLHAFEGSRLKPSLDSPRTLTYDLVARAVSSASEAGDYEIPLSFLRKAQYDMHADRYIEAFYNFFFFLETQFAPGFSNPKRVTEKLKASESVQKGISKARTNLSAGRPPDNAPNLTELLTLTNDQLIDRLVNIRGNLHHHAQGRPGIWHPDRQHEHRSEALLIGSICHSIAFDASMPFLYSKERNQEISRDAHLAGAVTTLRFEVTDIGSITPRPIELPMIGKKFSRRMLAAADVEFRKSIVRTREQDKISSYRILSGDGATVHATYTRLLK